MSHLISSPIRILDLDALRRAALQFGAQFAEKKTFHSYQGETKCDYVIALPTVRYEVGVTRNKDGSFSLRHDPYGGPKEQGYGNHDGHELVEKFGENLSKLSQAYSRQVVLAKARGKGMLVTERRLANGSIQLQLVRA